MFTVLRVAASCICIFRIFVFFVPFHLGSRSDWCRGSCTALGHRLQGPVLRTVYSFWYLTTSTYVYVTQRAGGSCTAGRVLRAMDVLLLVLDCRVMYCRSCTASVRIYGIPRLKPCRSLSRLDAYVNTDGIIADPRLPVDPVDRERGKAADCLDNFH